MSEGNSTEELVGIPTPDGVKNIHPTVLKSYKEEAFEILTNEAKAKALFKDRMIELEEETGIPKGVMTKWFKAQFKAKTQETKELAAAFEALDDAVA